MIDVDGVILTLLTLLNILKQLRVQVQGQASHSGAADVSPMDGN